MKIYTKTGDQGETCLVGGRRVKKTHRRLEANGSIDELNSLIGVCVSSLKEQPHFDSLVQELQLIQHRLFNLGSSIASDDPQIRVQLPPVPASAVTEMEAHIDRYTQDLPPLKNFILPGGSLSSSYLHLARTLTRRAEREVLRIHEEAPMEPLLLIFLNRLSDYFFTVARWVNFKQNVSDILWERK